MDKVSLNIPEKLILLTMEDSQFNCAVDYKSSRSLYSARSRLTSTVYDHFFGTSQVIYPDELLIDNCSLTMKVTDKQGTSPRMTSVHTIMCDVEFRGEHRLLPMDSGRILSIISKGSVNNGVIQDKIVISISNGIMYPYTLDEVAEINRNNNGVEKRKPSSKLEVGRVYTTPMGNSTEIYLGELYSHLYYAGYSNIEWYDEPRKVFLMFEPRYSGVLSMYDGTLKNKTLDDIFRELMTNTNLQWYSSRDLKYPLGVHALPQSIKMTKPPRFEMDTVFKYNNTITLGDVAEVTRKWTIENAKATSSALGRDSIMLLGLTGNKGKHELTEDELNKLLEYVPEYYSLVYKGSSYSGKRRNK